MVEALFSAFVSCPCVLIQATLERSETDTRQRLNAQIEKQEREISQLQKRLEHEVEQRHLLSRNQDVSPTNNHPKSNYNPPPPLLGFYSSFSFNITLILFSPKRLASKRQNSKHLLHT